MVSFKCYLLNWLFIVNKYVFIISNQFVVSPREINHKTNRSSNKKIKKDIIQNDSIDCTEETNFAHSLGK